MLGEAREEPFETSIEYLAEVARPEPVDVQAAHALKKIADDLNSVIRGFGRVRVNTWSAADREDEDRRNLEHLEQVRAERREREAAATQQANALALPAPAEAREPLVGLVDGITQLEIDSARAESIASEPRRTDAAVDA